MSADFDFVESAADDACLFFERYLRHVKGEWAGQPFKLQAWQRDSLIRPLFGWKRKDGTRRYRTCYCEMGRKGGKSSLAAGIALMLLFSDKEPGAEIYSCAADSDQAAIVFDLAKQMVEACPRLSDRVEIYRRSIILPASGRVYKVLSAEAFTKHGLNAHGIIFDELHAQPNRELWDVMRTSTGARRQPLTVAITTAGWDRHSICWEQHDYAKKVLAGVIKDDSFLPVIFAADEADDWKLPATWAKANPSLGVTVHPEFFAGEVAKAIESPSYENTFRRLFLSQWTEQAVRWLSLDTWDACAGVVDVNELKGRECYAGLDLASTTDIAALSLLFPEDGGRYTVLPFFWVPEENARLRERRDRVPYTTWIKQCLIEATPGNVIDFDTIRHRIKELADTYDIKEIAIDRWNSSQLTSQLMADGMKVVAFGQGFASMSSPTKELEALILSGKLRHDGNAVLRWMVSNVAVETDAAGNMKPSKKRSVEKVDGVVSTVMALGLASQHADAEEWYKPGCLRD